MNTQNDFLINNHILCRLEAEIAKNYDLGEKDINNINTARQDKANTE